MMEIILLEKIRNLGDLGDIVRVKNGYARNFLLPQKKAARATPEAKAEVERRRQQLASEESRRVEAAQARAELAVKEISLVRLCSDSGKLYGSVSPLDIAEALQEAGCRIERSEVMLPVPIKQIGETEVNIVLHPEVSFSLRVTVTGEEGADPVAAFDEAETEATDEDSAAEDRAADSESSDSQTPDAEAEKAAPKAAPKTAPKTE